MDGYYATPWDHGYGHVIKLDHDFIGRAALEEMAKAPARQKAWLLWNHDDTERVLVDSRARGARRPEAAPLPRDRGPATRC